MDSLAAVTLRNRLMDQLGGAHLPFTLAFDAPTIEQLASYLSTSCVPEASEQHVDGACVVGAPASSPQADQEHALLALSPGQAGMWLLQKLAPHSSCYNQAVACRINDTLDLDVLSRTFGELIRRHRALSLTVSETDTGPVHLFKAPSDWLQIHDSSQLDLEQIQAEMTGQVRRPFDLQAGPVFRVHVYTHSSRQNYVLLIQHHLGTDGYSARVLFEEWQQLYSAAVRDEPAPKLPPAGDYAACLRRQQSWLGSAEAEKQLAYWRQRLAGELPLLQLPTTHSHPSVPRFEGDPVGPCTLDARVSSALRGLAREHNATLTQVLLAAYCILLHRYSGQKTVLVGLPMSSRTDSRFNNVVGYFINPVVIRSDWSAEATFDQLLRHLRGVVVEALAHGQLPFPELVKRLGVERSSNRTPVFQTMFSLVPEALISGDGSAQQLFESLPIAQQAGQLDLYVEVIDRADGLTVEFRYGSAIFERATIERMAGHYLNLLEALLAEPSRPVGKLPMLTEPERHQLLEWNDTATECPHDRCVHQLFEDQARRAPEAVAAWFEGRQLTYGELNARSNQLAHHLRWLGVGPDVLVGICVERSLEMVVGLLGILKAGGAYVPLDPDYPAERLSFMLQDAQVAVLVTEQGLLHRLPDHPAPRVCLDRDEGLIAQYPLGDLPWAGARENLAYVIYTSGSTGKPKGVMIEHGSLANALLAMGKRPGISPSDLLLAVTTCSFDIAYLELFGPLIHGARIVIASSDAARDGHQLLRLLESSEATILQATPVTWRMLLASGWKATPGLRAFCGGEALSEELAQALVERTEEAWNMYGPTEATIWSSVHPLSSGESPIAIGRPLANTQYYVLDELQQPVPIGVPGELYIGGKQLTRGYLNRSELTAEKLVRHPFQDEPGARLYRTGDLCRWLPEGNVEFLGRIDQQVKLRGYRIELGEIEAALASHPMVREAVVLCREDEPGEKRLVAYLVPAVQTSAAQQATAALRQHLQQLLPDYMVPAIFVTLPTLPLTPNGKIDRKALPAPNTMEQPRQLDSVAPRTPTEEALVPIWRTVLGLQHVGVRDNFFDLGGHSLLVPALLAAIHQAFPNAGPISIRRLFEHPTLAEVACMLDAEAPGSDQAERVPTALMLRDAELNDLLPQRLEAVEPCLAPRAVFLTGATGYLGAYLLKDFLEKTAADVYCLVRADSEEAGLQRLEAGLRNYAGFSESWRPRLHAVLGDLSRPSLGLASNHWDHLAAEVDVICHNGALVSFVYPYEGLHGPNVEGTRTILRLATSGRIKTLLYISTISVFEGHGPGEVHEDDPPSLTERLRGGYQQSKWVAERLVKQAGERGLPVAIFRPGRIMGDGLTGQPNSGDASHLLLHASMKIGVLPHMAGSSGLALDLTPVDYVSQAILALAQQRESFQHCFHLLNPHPLHESAFAQIAGKVGFTFVEVPYAEWWQSLREYSKRSADEPLAMLLSSLPNDSPFVGGPVLRQEQTAQALATTSVTPAADAIHLLEHFLVYLREKQETEALSAGPEQLRLLAEMPKADQQPAYTA
jgi:amino acid adenylation domain-containing protein/thioester reductase-like protein